MGDRAAGIREHDLLEAGSPSSQFTVSLRRAAHEQRLGAADVREVVRVLVAPDDRDHIVEAALLDVLGHVIGQLAAQGKAIVFCSPVLEVVEKVCSHLLILRRGVVVAHGSIDEIRSGTLMPALEDTFLHLTEQVDADKVAGSILAAIHS